MITSHHIATDRLQMQVHTSGDSGTPVLFIHGNASSSVYWKGLMESLPAGFRGIAPDLRGYGDTEDLLIDASRGFGDWVDDIQSLLTALSMDRFHVVGHSLGGALIFSLIGEMSEKILSATLINPGSPFGFGGTKDAVGTACYDDFAGSGGGVVNPEFARLMGQNDRSSNNPQASPRVVMNSFYWKPPFQPENEEELLTGLLSQKTGENRYPGDFVPSSNYPFVAPGKYGPINAASPKYLGDSIQKFVQAAQKPSILWVRGSDDQIVSDNSLFDFGTLGKMGLIPNYPGEAVYPPQPMVSQTRHVLDQYQAAGGNYREEVMENTAHSPYLENQTGFNGLFHPFLQA
jgi:pimeloyl-ACP methyl ester carboxylesterase